MRVAAKPWLIGVLGAPREKNYATEEEAREEAASLAAQGKHVRLWNWQPGCGWIFREVIKPTPPAGAGELADEADDELDDDINIETPEEYAAAQARAEEPPDRGDEEYAEHCDDMHGGAECDCPPDDSAEVNPWQSPEDVPF